MADKWVETRSLKKCDFNTEVKVAPKGVFGLISLSNKTKCVCLRASFRSVCVCVCLTVSL
jgi:hypothetical protein